MQTLRLIGDHGHEFLKKNLVTKKDKTGLYDLLECKNCRMQGKVRNMSTIEIFENVNPEKIQECPNAPAFEIPEFIRITVCNAQEAKFSNLLPGTVHEVVQAPNPYKNDRKGVWVMGIRQPVKVFTDEYQIAERPVITEASKIIQNNFEKCPPDSNSSTIFVPVNSFTNLKNKKMSTKTQATKETKAVSLTKTEMTVMTAICSVTKKKVTDAKMVGTEAILEEVAKLTTGIDCAKVCRKLHRAGLVTYKWNEDKTRSVGVTEAGFEAMQVPVKVKAVKEPKAEGTAEAPKKGNKAKATEQQTAEAPKKKGPVFSAPGSTAEEAEESEESADDLLGEEDEEVTVTSNPVTKLFTITILGDRFTYKAKTLNAFKDLKKLSNEEWVEMQKAGELTEA
jgi:hypothetical protein